MGLIFKIVVVESEGAATSGATSGAGRSSSSAAGGSVNEIGGSGGGGRRDNHVSNDWVNINLNPLLMKSVIMLEEKSKDGTKKNHVRISQIDEEGE